VRSDKHSSRALLPLALVATAGLPFSSLADETKNPPRSDNQADSAENIPDPARTGPVRFPTSAVKTNSLGVFDPKGDPLQPRKGARVPGAGQEEPKEPEKPREWFGHGAAPWWEWSQLTGDWGGARSWLEEKGVAFGLTYTFDGASVLQGHRKRSVARGLLDLNITLETEPLIGWRGGTFFAQYYFRHGRSGAEDVGAIQGYSNIDAERLSRAEEVWFEQKFFHQRLRLKFGQVDANSEYAFVDAAGEFINPSSGYSPTIGPLPTYPDPALSVNAFIYPTDQLYLGGGFYGQNFKELDRDCFDDPFWIGEIGFTHGGEGHFAAGRLAFGAWKETASVDRFDGTVKSGTSGFYVVAEQVVWKENIEDKDNDDAQGVSLFGQYGWADDAVNAFAHHVAFGVAATGLLEGRDDDAAGLRLSWVGLTRAPGSGLDADETNLEFFYKAQITPALSIKPGLQWFHHPGGISSADDAVVATLRASFEF
jgi:porin